MIIKLSPHDTARLVEWLTDGVGWIIVADTIFGHDGVGGIEITIPDYLTGQQGPS